LTDLMQAVVRLSALREDFKMPLHRVGRDCILTTRVVTLPLVLAATTVLSACGGGGGGGATSDNGATGTSSGGGTGATTSYTINGVVAKGLVAGATVTAYCGGQASGTPWGTAATTDSNGNYSITATTACNAPLELVATTGGNATELDEITGVPLAATFTLKAYLATLGATNTLHITPLSDAAAAMVDAQKTATNATVTSAINTVVNNVLNGDSATYNATPMTPAQAIASGNQGNLRLAYLLTAISAGAYTAIVPTVDGHRNASQAVADAIGGLESAATGSNAAQSMVQLLQQDIATAWSQTLTGPAALQLINNQAALPSLSVPTGAAVTYTIGGTVSGLTGTGLVLTNTLGKSVTVSGNGTFSFPDGMVAGSTAAILVGTQPSGQLCSVTSSPETISSANVTDIAVACVPGYTLGGSLKGLATNANLVMTDSAGDMLTVTANGSFSLPTHFANGVPWTASIVTNPTGQSCSFAQGNQSNSGVIEQSNVQMGQINCQSIYPISLAVSGLTAGNSVSLMMTGAGAAQYLTVSQNGTASFPVGAPVGTQYQITVTASPTAEGCQFSGFPTVGSGTTSATSSNPVQLNCATGYFSIGGTVSGLAPGGTLALKETTPLEDPDATFTITANGSYTLPANVLGYTAGGTAGGQYAVTFVQQPTNQNCVWAGGVGFASAEYVVKDVTQLDITCTPAFPVTGTVTGIANSMVTITGTSNFPGTISNSMTAYSNNGAFQFIAPPGTYTVTPYNAQGTLTFSPASATVTVTNASPAPVDFSCVAGCLPTTSGSGGSVGVGGGSGTSGGSGSGSGSSGGGTGTCNFTSCVSPLSSSCISAFLDPNHYNWFSFQSSCTQTVSVTYVRNGTNSTSEMDLSPGQTQTTGWSQSEAPQGFTIAVCPIGYVPWDPNTGHAWNGTDVFFCAST
jgi:hypothetical protein